MNIFNEAPPSPLSKLKKQKPTGYTLLDVDHSLIDYFDSFWVSFGVIRNFCWTKKNKK